MEYKKNQVCLFINNEQELKQVKKILVDNNETPSWMLNLDLELNSLPNNLIYDIEDNDWMLAGDWIFEDHSTIKIEYEFEDINEFETYLKSIHDKV